MIVKLSSFPSVIYYDPNNPIAPTAAELLAVRAEQVFDEKTAERAPMFSSAREKLITILVDENVLAPERRPASPVREERLAKDDVHDVRRSVASLPETAAQYERSPWRIVGPTSQSLQRLVKIVDPPFQVRLNFEEDHNNIYVVLEAPLHGDARASRWSRQEAAISLMMIMTMSPPAYAINHVTQIIKRMMQNVMAEILKECLAVGVP